MVLYHAANYNVVFLQRLHCEEVALLDKPVLRIQVDRRHF